MSPHLLDILLDDLLACLSLDDPATALAGMLAALTRVGIGRALPGAAPWLEVSSAEQRLSLAAPTAEAPPHLRPRVAALLTAAMRRVDDQAMRARIEERARMLSAASFEGIFVHADNAILDLNDRMAEMVGYERSELLGSAAFRLCLSPEDQATVAAHVAQRREDGYVVTLIRKDGSRFHAELLAKQGRLGERPVRVVAVRDVTERERAQALLRESEQRLQQLADAAFDLTVLSRDGIVVDVRGPLETMTGYTREEFIGRPAVDICAPAERERVSGIIAAERDGGYDTVVVAKDGTRVPCAVTAVKSTLDGQPIRVAGVRDLSEARRLEAERRRLEQQVQQSQRLESLGVLAGGIAHDFNNLLVGVHGNAELLLERLEAPEDRESAHHILLAAQRAATLTAQMLAYAQQREPRSREPVDLFDVLDELRTLIGASLSKKAQLVLSVERGLVVRGDRTTLGQVLMNLLTNASDAFGDEPGRIHVRGVHVARPDERWRRAFGDASNASRYVLVEVSDSGAGMDERTLERIFEPFFTTKRNGHGLGLAACLGIVRAHGGAILVESEPGRGTTFSVLLPASDDAAPRPSEPPPIEPVTAAPSACHVLVVDDEPHVRMLASRILERNGFRVTTASDGNGAIAAIASAQPDIVLLDLTMPDLDGVEVLARIRDRGSRVPVILSSGFLDPGIRPGQFQGFLQKPYRVSDLLAEIERARRVAL